MKLKPR